MINWFIKIKFATFSGLLIGWILYICGIDWLVSWLTWWLQISNLNIDFISILDLNYIKMRRIRFLYNRGNYWLIDWPIEWFNNLWFKSRLYEIIVYLTDSSLELNHYLIWVLKYYIKNDWRHLMFILRAWVFLYQFRFKKFREVFQLLFY